MTSRREERIPAKLPVRVWGVDMNGMPFMQTAHAVDITRHGARLVDLYCLPEIGEITVQHNGQKARYKIAWTGSMGGSEAGEVGLRLLESEKNIWGKALAKSSAPERRGNGQGTSSHAQPSPLGDSAAAAVAPAGPAAYSRPRMHPRYPARVTTELLPDGAVKPVWATLTKISSSGFYCETPSPVPVDIYVTVTLRTLAGEIRATGLTRSSQPGAGMGIGFVYMHAEHQERLERFLEHAGRNTDARLELGVAQVEPVAQGQPLSGGSAALPPKTAQHKPISAEQIERNAKLAERLKSLILELRGLQDEVAAAGLDRRVTQPFENAVTHAHQNAEYLTQWLTYENERKDPYAVIEKINAERVRVAAEQARELLVDLDAQEIEHSTQGFDKLMSSVTALHKRLTTLLKGESE